MDTTAPGVEQRGDDGGGEGAIGWRARGAVTRSTERLLRGTILLDMLVLVVAGALFRLVPALASSIPLHDGGMFVSILRDIRATEGLPSILSYNQASIPFDYPPLAFLVGAILPFDPLDVVRMGGPIAATLTVPALYLLGLEILPARRYAFLAGLVYAMVPRAWDWLIAGGGFTRAPGLLFALLCVWQLLVMYRTMHWRNAVMAGVLSGLAALCHPEAALFVAMSAGLLALIRVRSRSSLVMTVTVGLIGLAVCSPWLAFLAAHGRLLDLLQAGSYGASPWASLAASMNWLVADEFFAPVVAALALFGALTLVHARNYFLPLWLLAEVFLAARGAANFAVAVMALLAAIGVYDSVGRGILHIPRMRLQDSQAIKAIVLLMIFWTLANGLYVWGNEKPPFDSLSPQAQATMVWLGSNTPSDSEFAVVSGALWQSDVYGEWLPALTGRVSMATMQGYEWHSRSVWDARLDQYTALQGCIQEDAGCVGRWMIANGASPGGHYYAYVAGRSDSRALMYSVAESPYFQVIHQGSDGVVAQLTEAPPPRTDLGVRRAAAVQG